MRLYLISSFIQHFKPFNPGAYSDEETPDPISNSEVKLVNVDGTWTLSPGRVEKCQV